jgi:hypothetical protein
MSMLTSSRHFRHLSPSEGEMFFLAVFDVGLRLSFANVSPSHCELETVVEYARTQQGHQDLVVSDARWFVHFVEIIE